jgi:hypothetical protein
MEVDKAPFKWQIEAAQERHYEEDFPDKSPFLNLNLKNGCHMGFEEALEVIKTIKSPNYHQLVFEVHGAARFDFRVLQLADAVADGLRKETVQLQELVFDINSAEFKEDQILQIMSVARSLLAELPRLSVLKIAGELPNQCAKALPIQLKKVDFYGKLILFVENSSSFDLLQSIADQAAVETVILRCQTESPPLEKFISSLASFKFLTKLKISSPSCSFIDGKYLGDFILNSQKLQELSLVDLKFSENTLKYICSAVKENSNIYSLELQPFDEKGASSSKAPISVENFFILLQSKSLKYLRTSIDDRYDRVKKQELSATKIQVLDIETSGWSTSFYRSLFDQLKGRIQTLSLSCSRFNDSMVGQVSDALFQFQCLEEINIKLLENAYFLILCDSIVDKSRIRSVVLSNNSLGKYSIQGILKLLSPESPVEHLDLTRNSIPSSAMPEIAEALKANRSLTSLKIFQQNPRWNVGDFFSRINLNSSLVETDADIVVPEPEVMVRNRINFQNSIKLALLSKFSSLKNRFDVAILKVILEMSYCS